MLATRYSMLSSSYSLYELSQRRLRVPVQHAAVGLEKERVNQAGKPFALAALQYHDGFSAVDLQDGHSGDDALWVISRFWVHNIIRTDHDCHIGGWKLRVNILQLIKLRVGYVCF